MNRMRWMLALAPAWATLALAGSASAAQPVTWTPARVASELVATDPALPVPLKASDREPAHPVPYGHFKAAICRSASVRLSLFRCDATYGAGMKRQTRASVWVRVRQFGAGSICASLRKPIPAGCWSTADGARAEGDAQTVFRQWLGRLVDAPVMDQSGTSCVGYGSGYWSCVDTQGETAGRRAVVVMRASGPVVRPL